MFLEPAMASGEIDKKNRVSQWRQLRFSSDRCAWNLSPLMSVFTRTLPFCWIRGVVSTTVECLLFTKYHVNFHKQTHTYTHERHRESLSLSH